MLATTKMKPCIEKSAEPIQKQPESLIDLISATNILILAILVVGFLIHSHGNKCRHCPERGWGQGQGRGQCLKIGVQSDMSFFIVFFNFANMQNFS